MKRILFVDDEPNILSGLKRMLRPQRKVWDVDFAVSGEAALAAMDLEPFDIVVTDMRMPGMNGAELLAKVKERFDVVHTEVTALAGTFYAAEEYHQDFYKKNPSHYYRYRKGCRRDERLEQLWGSE